MNRNELPEGWRTALFIFVIFIGILCLFACVIYVRSHEVPNFRIP